MLQAALHLWYSHVDSNLPSFALAAGRTSTKGCRGTGTSGARESRAGGQRTQGRAPVRMQEERREDGQDTGGRKGIFIHTQARKLKKGVSEAPHAQETSKEAEFKVNADILIIDHFSQKPVGKTIK